MGLSFWDFFIENTFCTIRGCGGAYEKVLAESSLRTLCIFKEAVLLEYVRGSPEGVFLQVLGKADKNSAG